MRGGGGGASSEYFVGIVCSASLAARGFFARPAYHAPAIIAAFVSIFRQAGEGHPAICARKQGAIRSNSRVQAGAENQKIEITPEMIEGGRGVVEDWARVLDPYALAEKAYKAMVEASVLKSTSS
ncbi:MAG: hypothetical protein KIS81_05580 [Maricaulaceae bacterium]|nr:hypothetical protein [Maricaulaceae bacterium]